MTQTVKMNELVSPAALASQVLFGDFLNFEQLYLLHLLVYQAEICRELSKSGDVHYVKNLSLIYIFDDVTANQE